MNNNHKKEHIKNGKEYGSLLHKNANKETFCLQISNFMLVNY